MDSKVAQFVAKTGIESSKAKELLHEHKGNLEEALKTFKFLQAALPPAGPQKNINGSNSSNLDKKLKRGLSKSSDNAQIVTKAREIVLQDIVEDGSRQGDMPHLLETSEYTFILPDITQFAEDFKAFLHKDLIETSTLVTLEQAGMWGFHDRLLTLRKALHTTLQNSSSQSSLWRRWRWHCSQVNKQSGLILSEEEWCEEWNYLLRQSSAKPRTNPGTTSSCCDSPATKGLMERTTEEKEKEDDAEVFYESLEEFHVFILAHVLHRPIVVVADTILKDADGDALAPIPFGGIYLPLQCKPSECHRSPLLLTYDAAHFSALVSMEMKSPHSLLPLAIPLVDPDFELLHIHFGVDPGPEVVWGQDDCDDKKVRSLDLSAKTKIELLRKYLDIAPIPIPRRRSSDEGSEDQLSAQHRSSSFSGALDQKTSSSSSSDSMLLSSGENLHIREKSNTLDGKLKPNYKEFKDKEKSKVAKQISKGFNSIGRSMSKKFKKMGKGTLNNREAAVGKGQRPSIGSITQSTKVNQLISLEDRERMLCAQLQQKRLPYQEEMVDNYLTMGRQRFEQDRKIKQRQDAEVIKKAEQRISAGTISVAAPESTNSPMDCINKDCSGQGTAQTCYLCPRCYEKQRQHSPEAGAAFSSKNLVKHAPAAKNPNLEHGRSNLAQPESTDSLEDSSEESQDPGYRVKMPRQNTLIETGKSKFYTYDDEEHSLPKPESKSGVASTKEGQTKASARPSDVMVTSGHKTGLNNTALPSNPLNNAKVIHREHNLTRPVSGTHRGVKQGHAVELARSSFYDEPLSVDIAAKSHALKADQHFVNNLHNEWRGEKDNFMRHDKHYSKPVPLAKEYTNEMCHGTIGGGASGNSSPNRNQAFKIKESQVQKTYNEYERAMQGNIQPKNIAVKNENLAHVQPAKGKLLQKPCKESGCPYFGSIATDFYCSACFKQVQRTLAYKASQFSS